MVGCNPPNQTIQKKPSSTKPLMLAIDSNLNYWISDIRFMQGGSKHSFTTFEEITKTFGLYVQMWNVTVL